MRGDSLRDFYAKTLAVVGLGLLAGAGAVVDYWPVGSAMPVVGSPSLPVPSRPELAERFDVVIPRPVFHAATVESAIIRSGPVGAAALRRASFIPALVTPEPEPIPVAPIPELELNVDASWPLVAASSITLAELDAAPPQPVLESPGMISGALRKTKDSIIRTGMVTGGSIRDAFKGVLGAFKKVTPF